MKKPMGFGFGSHGVEAEKLMYIKQCGMLHRLMVPPFYYGGFC